MSRAMPPGAMWNGRRPWTGQAPRVNDRREQARRPQGGQNRPWANAMLKTSYAPNCLTVMMASRREAKEQVEVGYDTKALQA